MREALERLDRGLRSITHGACLAAGWMLMALAVVVVVNIGMRKLFSFSLQGVDEYGGYCLALAASVGFSLAAFDRAHIRIDVVTHHLPLRFRALFDVLALLALNVTAWFLALKAFGVLQSSWTSGAQATSVLRTPLAWPQGVWSAALFWFCLVLSVQLLRALLTLMRADWDGLVDGFGVPGVDREVSQEIEAARRRARAQAQAQAQAQAHSARGDR